MSCGFGGGPAAGSWRLIIKELGRLEGRPNQFRGAGNAAPWLASGPETTRGPGESDATWLAVEYAAAALRQVGPDEAHSWLDECLPGDGIASPTGAAVPVCVTGRGDAPVEDWTGGPPTIPFDLQDVNRKLDRYRAGHDG